MAVGTASRGPAVPLTGAPAVLGKQGQLRKGLPPLLPLPPPALRQSLEGSFWGGGNICFDYNELRRARRLGGFGGRSNTEEGTTQRVCGGGLEGFRSKAPESGRGEGIERHSGHPADLKGSWVHTHGQVLANMAPPGPLTSGHFFTIVIVITVIID